MLFECKLWLDDEYYIPNSEKKIRKCSDYLGTLEILPYTSVIIGTYENVSLPDNVAGRFDLKITWALAGLIFQVGTQIEPGYDGKLFGVLHNLSNDIIEIPYRDARNTLLTAEFHYTSLPATADKPQKDNLYKIQDFISNGVIRGSLFSLFKAIDERNQEIKVLNEKLGQKVEKELESMNRVLDRVTLTEKDIIGVKESLLLLL